MKIKATGLETPPWFDLIIFLLSGLLTPSCCVNIAVQQE